MTVRLTEPAPVDAPSPSSRDAAAQPPSLRVCALGSAVEVQWIDLEDGERLRLQELGIREGAILHVVNCGAFGAKVVALGSDRFAIDGRTCACIAVIPQVGADHAVIGSRDLVAIAADVSEIVGSTTKSVLNRAAARLGTKPLRVARAEGA